jgi:hypothetical protein
LVPVVTLLLGPPVVAVVAVTPWVAVDPPAVVATADVLLAPPDPVAAVLASA